MNTIEITSINSKEDVDDLLELIAKRHLDIETLRTRHGDSVDFHDLAVWNVKKALQAAFEAGRATTEGEIMEAILS